MSVMVGKKINLTVHFVLARLVNDGKISAEAKVFKDLEPVMPKINGRTRLWEVVNIGKSFPEKSVARWVLRTSVKTVLDKLPEKARKAAIQEMKEGDPRKGQLSLPL